MIEEFLVPTFCAQCGERFEERWFCVGSRDELGIPINHPLEDGLPLCGLCRWLLEMAVKYLLSQVSDAPAPAATLTSVA